MSVVTSQVLCIAEQAREPPTGPPKVAAPLCGFGREAASLVPCHHGDLVLPQQISCATTAHLSSQRRRMFRCVPVIARGWWLRSGHLALEPASCSKTHLLRQIPAPSVVWFLSGAGFCNRLLNLTILRLLNQVNHETTFSDLLSLSR